MNIIYISYSAPYDTVPKAGQKVHNYYIKELAKQKDINVKLISFCEKDKLKYLDLEKNNIEGYIYPINKEKGFNKYREIKRGIFMLTTPNHKYAHILDRYRKKKVLEAIVRLKENNYKADLIIISFTMMMLLIDDIKKYYPESKYIANAHDVLYLNSYGKYCLEKNSFVKFIRKRQYKLLKSKEENVIPKFDYVFTLNYCDKQIINEMGQKNVSVIAPYYDDYYLESKNRKKRIIFFGAMNRPDNYLSCIWFIENVFNKLNRKDVEFYIIGGNPHESLFKYGKKDNNIKITGFISYEEIKKILSESICMVVPLINGSGIKIKVLEGFSAGIPVLSNNVGMRGIPARNKMDYLHCEKAEDFIKSIEFLINNPREIEKIGKNGYCFLHEKFNKRKSAELFIDIIEKVGYNE